MTMPETTPVVDGQQPGNQAAVNPIEGAVKEPVKVVEAPTQEERKYTQADLDNEKRELMSRIQGLDKKLSETTKSSKESVTKLEKAVAEAEQRAIEAQENAYLQRVKEDGGDVNSAQKTIERERNSRRLESDLKRRQQELDERDTFLAEAGRALKVTNLIKELQLDATVANELLECKTPEEMEIKALKLRLEKGAIDAKPVARTDSPDGGRKIDTSSMSLEERAAKAMRGEL